MLQGYRRELEKLGDDFGEVEVGVRVAVHDEIVVECDEGDADRAETWLKKAMVDGMDAVVNATEPQHVPIEVEATVSQAWGD